MTEEAFLLSSLKEVVNNRGRGAGQASFNLTVEDGVADLQLNFKLGLPTDAHLHHEHGQHPLHQHQEQVQKKKRCKGPARRDRDRARAAAFQACNQPETAASCHQAAAASQSYEDPVILPFTGKMLPLKKKPPEE